MAAGKLKPPVSLTVLAVFGLILLSLHMMSSATQDSSGLSEMYSWLLLINSVGTVLMLILVGANVVSLLRQLRKRKAGSRLTLRMVFLFVFLTLAPVVVVFHYSMQFLHHSIDSWFDVRIDRAMEDALKLSRASLDQRMQGLSKQTSLMARELVNVPDSMVAVELGELLDISMASELTLISKHGGIIASSGVNPGVIVPSMPEDSILLQLRQAKPYVGLDVNTDEGTQIRVLVPTDSDGTRYLQALYPVPVRIGQLTETVESAYVGYKQMSFLRNSLKTSFSLTLFLVLLLSLLAAVWVAFISIRRIVAPVQELVQATRAVAAGNYEQQLTVSSKDELGFLVESFNDMTRHISKARDETYRSQLEVENQRAYLQSVLGNLTSGVLSFDADMCLRTANQAAEKILNADLKKYAGNPLLALSEHYPHMADLVEILHGKLTQAQSLWQENIVFMGPDGRQELLCRGTPLFSTIGKRWGAVMVFDDVTDLIQAQKNAAWSEVARRLAHEIKNPLTPIQLSAERLQHKLWTKLDDSEVEILDRATKTIVQQVEALKTMVNAFSDYARPPKIRKELLGLNELIEEVLALYHCQGNVDFELELDKGLPGVEADPGRLRQVVHNLIKNALEAVDGVSGGKITIKSRSLVTNKGNQVEIMVRDNGIGIDRQQISKVFDPYVTNKSKGTGLGLAIVKKIIEEHGGLIWVDADYQDGCGFIFRLPAANVDSEAVKTRHHHNKNTRKVV